MPVYEFACPKGHVVEDLVPAGTETWPCPMCRALALTVAASPEIPLARRILSPTPTTFKFADRRRAS